MWAYILRVYHVTHQSPIYYKPLLPLGSLVLSLFSLLQTRLDSWIFLKYDRHSWIRPFHWPFLCLGSLPPAINPSHFLMLHSHEVTLHYCIWNYNILFPFYSALTLYFFLILDEWAILLCVVLRGVLGMLEVKRPHSYVWKLFLADGSSVGAVGKGPWFFSM